MWWTNTKLSPQGLGMKDSTLSRLFVGKVRPSERVGSTSVFPTFASTFEALPLVRAL